MTITVSREAGGRLRVSECCVEVLAGFDVEGGGILIDGYVHLAGHGGAVVILVVGGGLSIPGAGLVRFAFAVDCLLVVLAVVLEGDATHDVMVYNVEVLDGRLRTGADTKGLTEQSPSSCACQSVP